ncbi:MAG: ABC transporter permease [Spirochaetales bacterium]|nr:ABC transporter permease [Spirochaetales bacterium]
MSQLLRLRRTLKFPRALGLTLISIVLGFFVGAIVLLVAGYNPLEAYGIMIFGVFGLPRYISYTIIIAAPLILTGLSVTFAFRTGLFNIGAEGQFIAGSIAAVIVGHFVRLPIILHVPLVFVSAMVAGALWGSISGFLKARYGVHEVISTIMLNWLALYMNNYLIKLPFLHRVGTEASQKIQDTARIDILGVWKTSPEGREWRMENPFWGDILRSEINLGILFALIAAMVVWYIINRTTLGYELRAVGYNQDAANYGGIPVKKSMTVSMAIAGALAGAAGGIQIMGVTQEITVLAAMEGNGFDGIAVSLIGANTPIGVVLSGFLFGALRYGGTKIQPALGAPRELINIVMGTIVYFIAMPNLFTLLQERYFSWKKKRLDISLPKEAGGESKNV